MKVWCTCFELLLTYEQRHAKQQHSRTNTSSPLFLFEGLNKQFILILPRLKFLVHGVQIFLKIIQHFGCKEISYKQLIDLGKTIILTFNENKNIIKILNLLLNNLTILNTSQRFELQAILGAQTKRFSVNTNKPIRYKVVFIGPSDLFSIFHATTILFTFETRFFTVWFNSSHI